MAEYLKYMYCYFHLKKDSILAYSSNLEFFQVLCIWQFKTQWLGFLCGCMGNWMQIDCNSFTLLSGIEIGSATLENYLQVPTQIKHTYDPTIPVLSR